jgi:hypothetical protein
MIPPARPKQSLAVDLRDDLLRFIQQKFYPESLGNSPEEAKAYAQDRKRLIAWVILEPARFMNGKGFTVPADRYKQIITTILLEALRHGNTSKVRYRPGWLKHVIQTHFNCHWEEYYTEAKHARAQADHLMHVLGKVPRVSCPTGAPDPVNELANAANILARSKPAKRPPQKRSVNEQLSLV